MRQTLVIARPVEFSPEDAAMNGWFEEEGDYMSLRDDDDQDDEGDGD